MFKTAFYTQTQDICIKAEGEVSLTAIYDGLQDPQSYSTVVNSKISERLWHQIIFSIFFPHPRDRRPTGKGLWVA